MKGNLISLISVILILLAGVVMTGCAVQSSGSQISSAYEEKRAGWAMPTEMEAAENGNKVAGMTILNASSR